MCARHVGEMTPVVKRELFSDSAQINYCKSFGHGRHSTTVKVGIMSGFFLYCIFTTIALQECRGASSSFSADALQGVIHVPPLCSRLSSTPMVSEHPNTR